MPQELARHALARVVEHLPGRARFDDAALVEDVRVLDGADLERGERFSGPGRGCDNSANTGGALLSSAGTTNPDTLVLTSSGELATVLSIFLQGDVSLATPVLFGDGVRCVGGNLKRLYAANAVGGVISAPQPGDPSITTQSTSLGDPIAPGSGAVRYYQTYYRDPDLAFCPAPPGDSWNVSSGVSITW